MDSCTFRRSTGDSIWIGCTLKVQPDDSIWYVVPSLFNDSRLVERTFESNDDRLERLYIRGQRIDSIWELNKNYDRYVWFRLEFQRIIRYGMLYIRRSTDDRHEFQRMIRYGMVVLPPNTPTKHLRGKISALKATMDMHMHPEQHTVNSAALLHDVLNEMEKT
ncbi:hypothetical protein Tco_0957753 [Tanacetum coccineum]